MAQSVALGLVALALFAMACSDSKENPAENADGQIAPPSALVRWEESRLDAVDPAHVIRRYTAPMSPGRVLTFYTDELTNRGWTKLPGGDLSYVEWTLKGRKIVLMFEPPSSDGSEWSVLYYEAR